MIQRPPFLRLVAGALIPAACFAGAAWYAGSRAAGVSQADIRLAVLPAFFALFVLLMGLVPALIVARVRFVNAGRPAGPPSKASRALGIVTFGTFAALLPVLTLEGAAEPAGVLVLLGSLFAVLVVMFAARTARDSAKAAAP